MNAQPSDRHRSIDHRIRHAAQASTQDVQRVRRQLAFHRLLARVAEAPWVLKGGYCLEARLAGQARATKDIDFVRRGPISQEELLDELDGLFAEPAPDDGFAFEAVTARQMRSPEDPAPAWRVAVDCTIDGRRFERLTLDVVSQVDEVSEAVERLVIPSPVAGAGFAPVEVAAVDVYQHAAEKFHAMTRLYAGERPSSRVKDLVDLALLAEAGLLTDLGALRRRLVVVHHERDGAAPPPVLPEPPAEWALTYARLVADLHLTLTSSDTAFAHVHTLYLSALSEGPTP